MEFLQRFLISLITLAIFGLFCIIIQKISPANPSQKIWRKDSRLDLTYWAVSNLLIIYLIAFFTALVLTLIALVNPALMTHINSATNEIEIIGIIFSVILLDFSAYWVHRLFHTSKLWKYHAIHHSSKEVDWLSANRFHPIESIIVIIITYNICMLVGLGFKEVALALLIRGTYGYIVHANVTWDYGPLGYIIASPYFHRWHHTGENAARDKNFGGVFSAWDFIFGTAYLPKDRRQPAGFGIDDSTGESFIQHLIYPFKQL